LIVVGVGEIELARHRHPRRRETRDGSCV
jgi:hypothetical protein